jgi:sugar (pentulose or hexulose) kinase
MDTASEGGAWGMAVLAAFMNTKDNYETLPDYLTNKVFAGQTRTTISPNKADVEGFDTFVEKYKSTLNAEKAAVEGLR